MRLLIIVIFLVSSNWMLGRLRLLCGVVFVSFFLM